MSKWTRPSLRRRCGGGLRKRRYKGGAAHSSAGCSPAVWVLLLTATIDHVVDLRDTSFGAEQQIESATRRRVYERAVREWAQTTTAPIVLVENSGASLDSLRAQIPPARRPTFEISSVSRSAGCRETEIGCHEAAAILDGIASSRLAAGASHVLKVTGRYVLRRFDFPTMLRSCASSSPELVVQNPAWQRLHDDPGWRQETQVLGFRRSFAEGLFGWARMGGMCEECHVSDVVRSMRANSSSVPGALCDLPSLPLAYPVKEGSTGILRETL